MARFAIGVDLGGTNLRAAVIDESGVLRERVSGSTNLAAGPEAVMDDIARSILELRGRCEGQQLAGIGVAVPGIIEMKKGIVRESPNLPGFNDIPVRDEIERRIQAPVHLENDANAAALGEKWVGAGRGVDDLVLLTLGTGIGGGIICGGKILHGFVGMAGELGHIQVVPNGNPCACGGHGCLEKHASATAVTLMARLLGLGENLTSEQVFYLARDGNPQARVVFATMGRALGVAIADLVNIFNFPLYLLSGGALAAWEFFAPAMLEEVRRSSYVYRNSDTRIAKAELGKDAGLYGAARLPLSA
jgi:glucokinase